MIVIVIGVSQFSGASQIVLKPKTTEEVSAVLKYCNAENLAVCPQGGNTGLVGGSVPVFDEVIISTSLMNKIVSLDEISGTSLMCCLYHCCTALWSVHMLDQHLRKVLRCVMLASILHM
jgi:hypothetical protein